MKREKVGDSLKKECIFIMLYYIIYMNTFGSSLILADRSISLFGIEIL